MLFSSFIFLFIFLPVFLILYFSVKSETARNWVLLVLSLTFYSWGNVGLGLIMLSVVVADYYFAILVDNGKRKLGLVLTLCFNLGLLAYFKYTAFAFTNYNALLIALGCNSSYLLEIPSIILPIGISFHIFQTLSYVIDVYKGEVRANRNFLQLATFVTMFPQLVAGPIIKYHDIYRQLEKREITLTTFSLGLQRFIIGLGKKVLLANTFGYLADTVFSYDPSRLSALETWAGALAYSFQIYYDFSGYSDMAIGLGRMIGFDFGENFRYPYTATTIRDFWRRWHISLSTWFRDYLYIPLGGSRISEGRTYFNLLLVFLATGLWHGAGWTFIVWGLWHGSFIILERAFLEKWLNRLPVAFGHVYCLGVVLVGWVFFRSPDFGFAFHYVKTLFGGSNIPSSSEVISGLVTPEILFFSLFAVVFSMPFYPWLQKQMISLPARFRRVKTFLFLVCLVVTFVISCVYLSNNSYNPFIYFQF